MGGIGGDTRASVDLEMRDKVAGKMLVERDFQDRVKSGDFALRIAWTIIRTFNGGCRTFVAVF